MEERHWIVSSAAAATCDILSAAAAAADDAAVGSGLGSAMMNRDRFSGGRSPTVRRLGRVLVRGLIEPIQSRRLDSSSLFSAVPKTSIAIQKREKDRSSAAASSSLLCRLE